jgi:hypothetical protein
VVHGKQGLAANELAVELGDYELLPDHHLVERGQILQVGSLLGGVEVRGQLAVVCRYAGGVDV